MKFAKIGESVYHKWTCTTASGALYCMTVHTCTVDDGQGEKRILLDSKG